MGNGVLTANLEDYELPGVPWCMFFTTTGIALHGTYWHNDFGRPRSHGCVNMRSEDAKWLYRWTLPEVPYEQLGGSGQGTLVVVT
jgi:lipoprotein-anchoring transpeptidase ErfK/SrfK